MALLTRTLAFTLLAACYSPELDECTVTCVGSEDCARGQQCGSDGLCASPDRGTCTTPDAAPDASSPDARPPADAPIAQLTVRIDGRGSVVVDGLGTCDGTHDELDAVVCEFPTLVGATLVLHAIPAPDRKFEKWTTAPCAGQGTTCTHLVMTTPFTDGVKFK
jgi:hypothetical protein